MEGKLQVELAQLSYLLPRLVRQWKHLERLGGGIGTRGPGRDPARVRPPDDPPPHREDPRGAQARAGAPPARARPALGHRLSRGRARRLHQRGEDHAAQPAHRRGPGGRGPALRHPRPRGAAGVAGRATRPSSSPTPWASSASCRISWWPPSRPRWKSWRRPTSSCTWSTRAIPGWTSRWRRWRASSTSWAWPIGPPSWR